MKFCFYFLKGVIYMRYPKFIKPSDTLSFIAPSFGATTYPYNLRVKWAKRFFEKEGFIFPKIVFWNVAGRTGGLPVTKNDNDVIMVSGFSTNLLESMLDIENFNPVDQMLKALEKYITLIGEK